MRGSRRIWGTNRTLGDQEVRSCLRSPTTKVELISWEINVLTVYLASPLGFSPEWKSCRVKIKRQLHELECTVSDPWEQPFRPTIEEASAIRDWHARVAAFKAIAAQIGKANEDMIQSCDAVLGVLDGAELDSGTAGKIGLGAGIWEKRKEKIRRGNLGTAIMSQRHPSAARHFQEGEWKPLRLWASSRIAFEYLRLS